MLSHLSRIHGGLSNLSNCSISGVEPHSSLSSEYEIESNETVEDSDDEVYGNICNATDDDLQADVLEDSLIQNRAQDHVENIVLSNKVAALFLLNLKERHRVTQECIDFTVDQVQNMISGILDNVKQSVIERIECDDPHIIADINGIFDSQKPFRNLGSKYMQQLFYRNHFNLVVS